MKDYVITKNGEHCKNLGFDSIEGIYLTIETEKDLRKRFPNEVWSHEEYIEEKHDKSINTNAVELSNEPKKSQLFDEELFYQKAKDRVSMSAKEYIEKYEIKVPDKVEFDFVEWYSGVDREKVLRAYDRWKMENTIE